MKLSSTIELHAGGPGSGRKKKSWFSKEEKEHLATRGTSNYYKAPDHRNFIRQSYQAQHARISLEEMNRRIQEMKDKLGHEDMSIVHDLRHLAGLDW